MNYRQWKKKYKKEHGHNPISRRQAKKIANGYKSLSKAIQKNIDAIKDFTENFIEAISGFLDFASASGQENKNDKEIKE